MNNFWIINKSCVLADFIYKHEVITKKTISGPRNYCSMGFVLWDQTSFENPKTLSAIENGVTAWRPLKSTPSVQLYE